MHERGLMRDVLARIEDVARAEGAARVTRVTVRVGPLSHFTPVHFREHFADAALGTVADGAIVDVTADGAGDEVVVEAVEVEAVEVEAG